MDAIKAKAIRSYLGESMEKFAKRVGVAASTICAIENKQRDISDMIRGKLLRIEVGLPDDFYIFYEHFKHSA